MSRYTYQATVRHDALGKFRVIRGNDRNLVEASAYAQKQAWNEQYSKKQEAAERRRDREQRKRQLEDSLQEAEERTREAQAEIAALKSILQQTLHVDDRVDWDSLLQLDPFNEPQPTNREYYPLPEEPAADEARYKPHLGLIDKFWRAGAEKKNDAAQALFEADHAKWRERYSAVETANHNIYAENLREFEGWQRRGTAYEEARGQHNEVIERRRTEYFAGQPDAIVDYCDMVLSQSNYPDCLPRNFELDYDANSKALILEYYLPVPSDLPRIVEVKYVRSKETFTETELTKRQFEDFYEDVVCQIAIRTIHELLEADVVDALDYIVFDGKVRAINPGTGHEEERCILSLGVNKQNFLAVNLGNVQSRQCFDALGGISGRKLVDLDAVTPIREIAKQSNTGGEDITDEVSIEGHQWLGLSDELSGPFEAKYMKLRTVAGLFGFPQQDKYSLALSSELAKTVRLRGFAIEPDGVLTYRGDDEVALFKPIDGKAGTEYPGAAALLQLCLWVAAADHRVTDAELDVVREFISANLQQTPHERQRLYFFESLLLRNPQMSEQSLHRMVQRLPDEQRNMVAEVLVCVAGADGEISSSEWSALDQACKMLGLPSSTLEDILRRLGASFEEPTVQRAEAQLPGESLPHTIAVPLSAPEEKGQPSFKLDMEKVALISRETADVAAILSKVMQEENTDVKMGKPEPTVTTSILTTKVVAPVEAPEWLKSLEVKYQQIAARVIHKPSWSKCEFQKLAAEFKLLPLGVYDAINEWSDEHLGDFLLEGEDPIVVNSSMLPK